MVIFKFCIILELVFCVLYFSLLDLVCGFGFLGLEAGVW